MICIYIERIPKIIISPYLTASYEKEGLLPAIHRDANRIRHYSDTDLEWLNLVCCMRATGMSIAYIKNYIDLCHLGKDTIPERRQIILNQKDIIETELKKYKNLLKLVNKKLEHYDDISRLDHTIINPEKALLKK